MGKCEACGKSTIGRDWIKLKNEEGKKLLYHWKCYLKVPKHEKKKLTHLKSVGFFRTAEATLDIDPKLLPLGLATADGPGTIDRALLRRKLKKNYTEKELDEVSIEYLNRHYGTCTSSAKALKIIEQKLNERK